MHRPSHIPVFDHLTISGENKIHESPYYFIFLGQIMLSFLSVLPGITSVHFVSLTTGTNCSKQQAKVVFCVFYSPSV
jgi:hypothetical protein